MLRSVAFIVAALRFVGVAEDPAREYAPHLQALAVEHEMDPVTLVAMGWSESRWNPAVKNVVGTEEYVGVFQIRLRNAPECNPDRMSPECDKTRQGLESWHHNAIVAARLVTINRDYCRDLVGSALLPEWLASFGGFNQYGRVSGVQVGDRVCGRLRTKRGWMRLPVPEPVQRVIRKRLEILRILGHARDWRQDGHTTLRQDTARARNGTGAQVARPVQQDTARSPGAAL